MKLFDATLGRLERALDLRLLRHNALASNLANVDTPGYKAKDIDFAAAMEAVSEGKGGDAATGMRITRIGHMDAGGGIAGGTQGGMEVAPAAGRSDVPLVETQGEAPSIDGNQVDLDRTMVALAENGLQYGASARAAGKKLAILRYVASDGVG